MGGDRLKSSNILAQVGKQIFRKSELLKGHSLIGLMSGQGELRPQMGLPFLDIKDDSYVFHVFDKANELFHKWNPERGVGFNYRDIIEKGTENDISQTAIAQPLLVILSLLSKYVLKKGYNIKPILLAGHSAGEYSALAENCLDLDTALEVIIARGRITQEEVLGSIELEEPQTMMFSLKSRDQMDFGQISKLLQDVGEVSPNIDTERAIHAGVSLINGQNDLVIWSEKQYAEQIKNKLTTLKIRTFDLNIPTAFHADTPTMRRVAERMKGVLESFNWKDPETPILMNATHQVAHRKDEVVEALIANHTTMVDWLECMREMSHNGINAAVQFGPGSFLAKQIEQVIPGVVTDYSDIQVKRTI